MDIKKLRDLGAEEVGGFVYLNRVHVGTHTDRGLVLTSEGEDAVAGQSAKTRVKTKTAAKPETPEAEELERANDSGLTGSLDALVDAG